MRGKAARSIISETTDVNVNAFFSDLNAFPYALHMDIAQH